MSVAFFSDGVSYKLQNPESTSRWLENIVRSEGKRMGSVNVIFCTDPNLRRLNKKYLDHNFFTDILTFDGSEKPALVEGEVFISVRRVRENSRKYKTPFEQEIHRVIAHGILHLVGYNDKSDTEKALMREKEDAYLSLRRGRST